MSLPHLVTRAASGLLLALSLLVLVPRAALAHEPAKLSTPQPVIDRAPRLIAFGADAVVRGHLEGGVAKQRVSLERKVYEGEWYRLATKRVDERARVRFRIRDLHRSAAYRLSYEDEATVSTYTSDKARIKVRPELTLRLRPPDAMQGGSLRLRGHLFPAITGRRAVIEEKLDGRWRLLTRVRVGDGWFRARVSRDRAGFHLLRVRFAGDYFNASARRAASARVYRPAYATWYGPGLYGNRLACGGTLAPGTLGVAHRSLPCGSRVRVFHAGRTIAVRVIDRGPYTSAEFDLTEETARRVGFSGTGYIGVIHWGMR